MCAQCFFCVTSVSNVDFYGLVYDVNLSYFISPACQCLFQAEAVVDRSSCGYGIVVICG